MAPLSSASLARVMDVVRTVARTLIASDGVTFVVREGNSAIGAYWTTLHEATRNEIDTLKAIADSALLQIEE